MTQFTQALPTPHSEDEYNLLKNVVQSIPYFSQLNQHEQNSLIENLAAYECYSQCIALLEWRIANTFHAEEYQLNDYVLAMNLWYLGAEDWNRFIEVARTCIAKLKIGFTTIRIQIAQPILGKESYSLLAKFYNSILDSIAEPSQKVLVLEHLAFLSEKKLFLENQVEEIFDKILEIDPGNYKALRYYKQIYVNSARWRDAAKILSQMVERFPPGFEQNRASFELAQVYLYQLNQPHKAKDILSQLINKTTIDISQTYIEALERLGSNDELLDYLKNLEFKLRSPEDKCENKQRLGIAYLKLGQPDLAIAQLSDAVKMNPKSLEAHESHLSALVEAKRTIEVVDALKVFQSALSEQRNKQTIGDLIKTAEALI